MEVGYVVHSSWQSGFLSLPVKPMESWAGGGGGGGLGTRLENCINVEVKIVLARKFIFVAGP